MVCLPPNPFPTEGGDRALPCRPGDEWFAFPPAPLPRKGATIWLAALVVFALLNDAMEIRHLIITGSVQGVGYRYSMVREAQRLNVTGWVRNRGDGSVEATVAGTAEDVAAMIAWARRGPSGAQVAHVAVELGSGSFQGFDLQPSV